MAKTVRLTKEARSHLKDIQDTYDIDVPKSEITEAALKRLKQDKMEENDAST